MSSKIKKIIVAVITLLTPFLLSYKVIAVEISQNVEYIGSWQTYPYFNTTGNCNVNNSGSIAGYAYNAGTGACTTQISFQNMAGKGFNNQYVLEVSLYFYELRDREPLNTYNNGTPGLYLVENGSEVLEAEFLGRSTTSTGESSAVLNYYFRFNVNSWRVMANGSYLRLKGAWGIQPSEYASASNKIGLWALSNGGVTIDTQGIINKIQDSNNWLAQINQNIQELRQSMVNSGENQLNEAEQRSEEAAQEGENNANQGQTDSEQASTNVIGAIGNVIGAFNTGARSNCELNMNLGNIDFGRVDFCKGKPSAWQQMLGGAMSIVLVYVVYRVAKNVFNVFMSAMVFAQGGDRKDG